MKTLVVVLLCLVAAGSYPGQAGDDGLSPALRSLVDAERSFARRCGVVGIRASFLEFFEDSAIAFAPEPVRYKEAVKGLPSPSDPLAVRLEWEPQTGDVSASSDLGFTTGPSVRTNTAVPDVSKQYGQFLSVWKKQSDGAWKVAVDIGVSAPAAVSPLGTPFKTRRGATPVKGLPSGSSNDPVEIDRELSRLCSSEGLLDGYLSRASEEVQLLRESHRPVVGIKAAQSYLTKEVHAAKWSPISGEISHAGDLCYTYGSYEMKPNRTSRLETGYYLHVWRRNDHGEWKLVADATNPDVPAAKK
jgi:ketosteroid isomerase-like protein